MRSQRDTGPCEAQPTSQSIPLDMERRSTRSMLARGERNPGSRLAERKVSASTLIRSLTTSEKTRESRKARVVLEFQRAL